MGEPRASLMREPSLVVRKSGLQVSGQEDALIVTISSLLAVLELCQECPGYYTSQVSCSQNSRKAVSEEKALMTHEDTRAVKNTRFWWQRAGLSLSPPLGPGDPRSNGECGSQTEQDKQRCSRHRRQLAKSYGTPYHTASVQPVDTLGLLVSTCLLPL